MTLLQALLLGIVQGATEYIPVSSTAHLVLVPWLLRWNISEQTAFVFDVLVQLGTLAAVAAYFWRDLWEVARGMTRALLRGKPFEGESAQLGWFLLVATIPAGLAGLLLKDFFESVFGDPMAVAALLLGTAALLALREWLSARAARLERVRLSDAIIIGCWQILALLPGISRSGATIAGGLTRGLTREAAARFSFLMSIPVLLAAGLLAARDMLKIGQLAQFLPVMLVGFFAAAVVGFGVIAWLMRYLRQRRLYVFALYCTLAGLGCLLAGFLRG